MQTRTKRVPLTSRGVSLPEELDRKLVKQAEDEQRPVSWVIRRAVDAYLKTAKGKAGEGEHEHR